VLALQAGTHELLARITLQRLRLGLLVAASHPFMLGVGRCLGRNESGEGAAGGQQGKHFLHREVSLDSAVKASEACIRDMHLSNSGKCQSHFFQSLRDRFHVSCGH
jgi:hypothetical protein